MHYIQKQRTDSCMVKTPEENEGKLLIVLNTKNSRGCYSDAIF